MNFRDFITDPVLVRSDFRCEYCGVDLLSDYARDHVTPQSQGGGGDIHNRAAACAACDRLKGGTYAADIEEARKIVAARRGRRLEWFDRIREMIRS